MSKLPADITFSHAAVGDYSVVTATVTFADSTIKSFSQGYTGGATVAQAMRDVEGMIEKYLESITLSDLPATAKMDVAGRISDVGGGPIQVATVTLSSAQIKNLRASAATLVAAPGANKYILPITTSVQFKTNATPYTDGGSAVALLAPDWGFATILRNIMVAGVDALAVDSGFQFQGAASGGDPALADNLPLQITNTGVADFADGDGTLTVIVVYAVVTLQA